MLAAARIGAVVVPFSTFATARELREQLIDSDAEILLAAASYRSHDYVQRLTEVLSGLRLRRRRTALLDTCRTATCATWSSMSSTPASAGRDRRRGDF